MARSYALPDGSFYQETGTRQNATVGGGYINEVIAVLRVFIRSMLMT